MSDAPIAWDPDRYLRFRAERFAPFDDLAALVDRRAAMSVVDLGCGTGELTRRLADSLEDATVVGVDNSPEMLARAAEFARDGLRFELADLETFDGEYDLVISNAAIHWVADQAGIVGRLHSMLATGGQLVVQVPANHDHPSHALAREVAEQPPFAAALSDWRQTPPVLRPQEYATVLWDLGATQVEAFEKVYLHVLDGSDAIVDWMRGTGLRAYLERLPAGLRDRFMSAYGERVARRYPGSPVLFTFNRTFFSARMPS